MAQREELEAAVPHREQSVREVRSYNKLAGGGGGGECDGKWCRLDFGTGYCLILRNWQGRSNMLWEWICLTCDLDFLD